MKNFKKILGNQQGMSLIEVIVAAAISVIVSGAVMKTNESGIKGMNAITTKMSLSVWKSTVLLNKFNDPDTCRENFTQAGYTKAGGATSTRLYNSDGSVLANGGDLIEGSGGDWKFISVTYAAFDEDTAGSTKGSCDAKLTVESLKNSYGTKIKVISLPIVCTYDASVTTFQSCSASSDGMDSLWNNQLVDGSNLGYIFRNDNVLIGPKEQTIRAPFEVNYEFSDQWPIGSSSGVKPSIKISKPASSSFDHALVFNSHAYYEDSAGCLINLGDNAGAPTELSKSCLGSMQLHSSSITIAESIGTPNVAIASRTATISGGFASTISSENVSAVKAFASVISSTNSVADAVQSAVIASTGNGTFASRVSGSAVNSVVLGASNVTVSGARSVGMGEDNIVSGQNALVAGYNNTVSGRGSMSLGYNNNISGSNSFSAGFNNTVSGTGSVALGYNASVTGNASLAGGTSSANGWASLAFGQESVSNASKSITIGWNSVNNGANAKLFADHSDISGSYSVAMGYDLSVTGSASMALGFGGSATNRTIESQSSHFTGMFNNGFAFKTDPWNQNDTTKNVYITGDGQLLVGNSDEHPVGSNKRNFQVFSVDDPNKYSLVSDRTSVRMADGRIIAWGLGDQMWTGLDSYDDNWQSVGVGLVPTRGQSTEWPMQHLSTFGVNMGYSDGDKKWRISSDGSSNGSAGLVMNYGPGWVGLYAKTTNGGWGHNITATELSNYIRMKVEGHQITANVPMKTNTGSTVTSDRRLKKDFIKIENPVDKLSRLNGYHYTWKAGKDLDKIFHSDEFFKNREEKKDIGLVAQEVEDVFPELVMTDREEHKMKSVNYSQLVAVVIEGIKELSSDLKEVIKDIMGLNDKVDLLERKVSSLEEENRLLRAQFCELHPKLNSCKKK